MILGTVRMQTLCTQSEARSMPKQRNVLGWVCFVLFCFVFSLCLVSAPGMDAMNVAGLTAPSSFFGFRNPPHPYVCLLKFPLVCKSRSSR